MKAVIVVDLQNDFLPTGALPVQYGDQVIPVANQILAHARERGWLRVATRDFHPADHGSFASQHPGKAPFEVVDLNGLEQVLWPDHCVQGSAGSEFAPTLDVSLIEAVFIKGTDRHVDSYSGFFDNGQRKATGLGDYLKGRGVSSIIVFGLATDVCVKHTALDGVRLGFDTWLVQDASRGVELAPGDVERALAAVRDAGGRVVQSADVLAQ